MKKTTLALLLGLFTTASDAAVENPSVATEAAQFKARVLIDHLQDPWEMLWGADDHLWLTERQSKQISRVNPNTGEHQVLYTFANAFSAPPHQGVLGMALHPAFLKGKQTDFVYAYYTYSTAAQPTAAEFGRLVRLRYDSQTQTLGEETVILDKLPAGDDHNAGRLIFGKDGKLYLSLGDNGHNQYANRCQAIRSQDLPNAEQIVQGDFENYQGKILRLNTDGTIPEDNPRIHGVKSHIYAYGFRNPQGLVFVGDKLFNVDQGPGSDDEVNVVEAGGNYGWPYIAGYQDNQAYQYVPYAQVENCANSPMFDGTHLPEGVKVTPQQETDVTLADFKAPQKTFFTVPNGYVFNDPKCNGDYLCWPTVATTSIAYYPKDGKISSFQNSLLVTGVKTGTLYRLPLDGNAKQVQGEVITHFRTDNRYRMVLVSPDTSKIYIATDSAGYIMGKASQPTKNVANKGAILVFEDQTATPPAPQP